MDATNRWMVVGEDPNPTEADLPIVVEYPAGPVMHARSLPRLDKPGDRWCRITLPPDPEDEGVEVEGFTGWWRVNGEWVERGEPGCQWYRISTTKDIKRQGERAITLGLVSAPVPADAALSWPPMRPMDELPESGWVLAVTDRSPAVRAAAAIRNDDRWLGWWPLPPVPTTEEA